MSSNKEGKKPLYKDYVNFLDSYKNGKKDDSTCYSLTNSSNNSSTSINSDHQTEPSAKSFKEYLDHYENKKFSSVKPTFPKNDAHTQNKIVKTEIFININNEQTYVSDSLKKFENSNTINGKPTQVGKVTKMFEKPSNGKTISKTVSPKANKFQTQHAEPENDIAEEQHVSVEEMSKKFQANNKKNCSTLERKRPTLQKQNSIKEKSKLFENETNDAKRNGIREPSRIIVHSLIKRQILPPSKQLDVKIGENIPPKSPNKPNIPVPPASIIIKDDTQQVVKENGTQSESTPQFTPPSTCVLPPSNIPPPPPIPGNNFNMKSVSLPPPAPPSFVAVKETPKISNTPSAVAVKSFSQQNTSIPIPPPPPPSNFSMKPTSASATNHSNITKMNGYNTLPKMHTVKQTEGVDGIPVPTLDKNDPRVKKLVYGAFRNMCGAYHGQANDYLATLPKNRVRKNNGLDSIINNIASQGGLDKLSGRANPKTETELRAN